MLMGPPPQPRQPVTQAILVACGLVYALGLLGGASMTQWLIAMFAFVPAEFSALLFAHKGGWVLVQMMSSTLLHAGLMHLVSNGIFLWFIGRPVEWVIGGRRLGIAYAVSVFTACIGQWLSGPNDFSPVIGASGPISGLFGIYLLLFSKSQPDGKRFLGITIAGSTLRILWFIAMWVMLQVAIDLVFNQHQGSGIAIWAHVGGFLGGLACGLAMLRGRSTRISSS